MVAALLLSVALGCGGTGEAGTAAAADIGSVAPGSPGTSPDGPVAPPAAPPIASAAVALDRFGIPLLHATTPGGREWFLPDDAHSRGDAWFPETASVSRVTAGIFRTSGELGQVRLNVTSPAGAAWWRNVEMTAYFRQASIILGGDQVPHWELLARGERHSSTPVAGDRINFGVPAPAGTITWPGYPYGAALVNPRCLGTSYHGNVYPEGRVALEKELSHTEGYGDHQRGTAAVSGLSSLPGRWFGMKLVVRNHADGLGVRIELWVDVAASGQFERVAVEDDRPGAWPSRTPTLDGCGELPFGYASGTAMTWAGPWVTFRSDAMATDFKWLSVREIAPLP